jgi:hypothetical protein
MATLGTKNLKHTSPAWMINLTGTLAIITPILPSLIQTMPGSISNETKDWLLWILSALTALSAATTMFAKASSDIGDRPKHPRPRNVE